MENIKKLESFGIPYKEAKILYACMKSKGVRASDIAKKTDVERTNVYKILEKLIAKGLVTTYKSDNVTKYRSLDPETLLELLKNNVKEFEKNLSVFKKFYSNETNSPQVELFSGRVAVKRVLISIVNKNQPYYVFGGIEQAYRQNYFENIPAGLLAKEMKVKGKIILSPNEKLVILSNEEYKISQNPLPKNICTIITKDFVAILNWGEYCNAILITDKKISKDYLILFESLWKQAQKISLKKLSLLKLSDKDLFN
jgi:sugar-specific transcriptional regulator TrmB